MRVDLNKIEKDIRELGRLASRGVDADRELGDLRSKLQEMAHRYRDIGGTPMEIVAEEILEAIGEVAP